MTRRPAPNAYEDHADRRARSSSVTWPSDCCRKFRGTTHLIGLLSADGPERWPGGRCERLGHGVAVPAQAVRRAVALDVERGGDRRRRPALAPQLEHAEQAVLTPD